VWKLAAHVCHAAGSDAADGEDGLGDILDRVGKAYVRSATAFARYAVDGNGCAHATQWANPVCDAGTEEDDPDRAKWAGNTLLHDQLLAAAASQPHAGSGGTGRGKIVTLEEMLVRLAGLAVVAHVDRTDGLKGPDADEKSTCFGNPSSKDAKTMCDELHASYTTWLGNNGYTKVADAMGSTSRAGAIYNEFYHNPGAMHTGTPACPEGGAGVNGSWAETDKYLTAAEVACAGCGGGDGDGKVWAFRQQCLLQHRPGMIDQESLFGLPDFERFPMLKQRTRKVGIETVDRDRYNAYMDSYFYHPMEVGRLNATDEPSTDVRRLHLYTVADLAVSMWWALPTLCALTFWALSAAWEVVARVLDIQRLWSNSDSVLRSDFPPSPLRVSAWITSVACVAWIYNVHPWPVVTAPRFDPTCEDHRLWGSVYGISNVEEASAAWLAATALFFIVLVDVLRGILMLMNYAAPGFKTTLLNYLVRGLLQLLMLGLAIGLLAHVSNLFTRHAANLVFVLQTQDDSHFFSAMHELKLGTRIASSGLMLYSNAFAVTVAAGSVALLWTLPRDGQTKTKDGEKIINPVKCTNLCTMASLFVWAVLVLFFFFCMPPIEDMAAHDRDNYVPAGVENQFAGFDGSTLAQVGEFFNITDDIGDGHADSTVFADDFGGYYGAFVVLVGLTLGAWAVAMLFSSSLSVTVKLTADGESLDILRRLVPDGTASRAPGQPMPDLSTVPLLPLKAQQLRPSMRR
jgi:hypothetical protein